MSVILEARDVERGFGDKPALRRVTLSVSRGEIHALLGPNGAGKTTLLRLFAGLLVPDSGSVHVLGLDSARSPRALRQQVGMVPSGDRSFYLRISGLENLAFFARLHGMRRRPAVKRAWDVLAGVDLVEAAHQRVGAYSHGMIRRLSFARALLTDPAVLLVDEATHDLDPLTARRVRALARTVADEGTAIIWATQRVDEIRSFAQRVTLLSRGRVCFAGTVPDFVAKASATRYLVTVANYGLSRSALDATLRKAVAGLATINRASEESAQYLLSLASGVVVGDALTALIRANLRVLGCREERSEVEEAFLALTGDAA